MTREEALQWLTNEKWKNANNKYKKEWNEAFEMAIEALSVDAVEVDRTSEWVAVRREEYEDLIADAEQVTGKLQNPCDSLLTDDSDKCKEQKRKLESADAVQGEWIKVEEQPYFRKHYDTVCCSVCRKKGNRKWNYCPSCGARMKGGAE